ncbi:ABC transporter ATP-binding protein [Sporosarcina pasteurii]|uniref:Methionine import ATP-binding protein MetN 2 n=1 Tax=Sporosarcina pasteurii TaxID=1474 RepID=A0A380C903_SPOPA|nr:ATP-binding cassette domain-containing protein [Sporosarcina pasteurii]MDS9472731.1 ATP-binding cassette domain-containing protein [Sporosarcina pasteurii]QBQ04385.1 ATP-binding cassette domain-containing protein [Sporosarcina pasteurii]SUJ15446.1 Methionine import ATP-binding protein MetN 2 [Sporosarcina pasteurii]
MRLEANHIGFRYGNDPWLLKDVHFAIEPGEVVGLTGASGRGKTTFCRILAGFEQPLEGDITLGGNRIPNKGMYPVQLVLQHPEKAVNPRWKMQKVLHESGQPDPELLTLLGIKQSWLSRWPNELSGGELQRFCVARALASNPRYLIADEMTTMLDAITQAQIWQAVLETAKKRNMGIIVVSHEKNLIQRLCDRVVEL